MASRSGQIDHITDSKAGAVSEPAAMVTESTLSLHGRQAVALLITGFLTALLTFAVVQALPTPVWHLGRDLELRATVAEYEETGVLLVKQQGTGSWYTASTGPKGIISAAWDDDPGTFVAASVISRVVGTTDPYRAIQLFEALLAALPWLWIPLTLALAFNTARAGWASLAGLVVVPLVTWRFQVFGSDYRAPSATGGPAVYGAYAAASAWLVIVVSLLFLSWCVFRRNRRAGLLMLITVAGVGAAFANSLRSMSGLVVIGAAAVLIASLPSRGWVRALSFSAVLAIAFTTVTAYVAAINSGREAATGLSASHLPAGEPLWHNLYLGLAFEGDSAQTNPFGIVWSDGFAWAQARNINPKVVVMSKEYDAVMRHLYLHAVTSNPLAAARTYVEKAFLTVFREGRYLLLVACLFGAGLLLNHGQSAPRRRAFLLLGSLAPGIIYGFLPPTLVMPYRYYFIELTACLSLAVIVCIAWVTVVAVQAFDGRWRISIRSLT